MTRCEARTNTHTQCSFAAYVRVETPSWYGFSGWVCGNHLNTLRKKTEVKVLEQAVMNGKMTK